MNSLSIFFNESESNRYDTMKRYQTSSDMYKTGY